MDTKLSEVVRAPNVFTTTTTSVSSFRRRIAAPLLAFSDYYAKNVSLG